eukprot:8734383-Pyramimonas_sp.AAC.1
MKGDQQLRSLLETDNGGQGGSFDMRSALGGRLTREMGGNPSLKKKYDLATCKDTFKKEWAKAQYDGLVTKHRVTTRETEQDWISTGKLCSFLKMTYEEGGPLGQSDPHTISVCLTIRRQCIKLGYPFAQKDRQSGELKFMHFTNEFKDHFRKKWAEHETQHEKQITSVEAADCGGSIMPKPKAVPKPKTAAVEALNTAKMHIKKAKDIISSADSLVKTIDKER